MKIVAYLPLSLILSYCSPAVLSDGSLFNPGEVAWEFGERPDADSLRSAVHLYIALREYDRADSLSQENYLFPEGDPDLGRMYLLVGEYEKALTSLTEEGNAFQLGYCYEGLGETEEAVLHYENALEGDSLLRDYCLIRMGACYLADGDYEKAIAKLRKVEELPRSSLVPVSYEEMARAYEEMGEVRKASWLRKLIGRRWPEKKSEMEYEIAEGLEAAGSKTAATRLYYRLVKTYPESRAADKALERLRTLARIASRDLFRTGTVSYRVGASRRAAKDLEGYLNSHPGGRFAREARYLLGKALYRLGRYRQALGQFQGVVGDHKRDEISLKALFNVARCQDRLGKEDETMSSYRRLVEFFPESYLADDALYRIGRFYERAGDWAKAMASYRRLAQETKGDYTGYGLLRMGLLHLKMGEPELAAKAFRELLATRSRLEDAAAYWLARSLEGDDTEGAQELYRDLSTNGLSFYSAISLGRLALPSLDPPGLQLTKEEPEEWICSWSESPSLSPEEVFRVRRGERLFQLGFLADGSRELRLVGSWNPLVSYRIASLFGKYGSDSEAIAYGSRVLRRAISVRRLDFPSSFLRLLYPTPYLPTVQKWGDRFGVDPLLLLALIREESRFNPGAVSRAGAIGLTQVMPSTGKEIATGLGDENFRVDELLRPEKSIQYGSFYLSRLIEDFGRVDLALAAYNGGPDQVKEWVEDEPNPEEDWFVENIPFWETRGYVKRVLSSLMVYELLYANQ